MKQLKIIGFDADDTLWLNESFYQETERQFCSLLADFADAQTVAEALFSTEMQNMSQYGYGAKAFTLSLIETALKVSNHQLPVQIIQQIIALGKNLIGRPIVVLDGVEDVLKALYDDYLLVVVTKGDLLDQERKLQRSALEKYFHHVEIMSNKTEKDYIRLWKRLDVQPEEFVMIGNSMKSDIAPVLRLGGYGIHVPHHTTWLHETMEEEITHPNLQVVSTITDVLASIENIYGGS